MKTQHLIGGALGALCMAVATQACATVYLFSFTGSLVDTWPIFGEGTFTTSNVGNGDGSFTVTAITGTQTVGADTSAITGLSAYAASDQRLFVSTANLVDYSGISFSTASMGNFNYFFDGARQYQLSSVLNSGGSADGTAPGRLTITAVPEPASWALMLTGFFGLGLVLRRRRAATLAA